MDKVELDLSAQYTPIRPVSEEELCPLSVLTVHAKEYNGPDRSPTFGGYPSHNVDKKPHIIRLTVSL